jgi:hypothetical protein
MIELSFPGPEEMMAVPKWLIDPRDLSLLSLISRPRKLRRL